MAKAAKKLIDIPAYHLTLAEDEKNICDVLYARINMYLKNAEARVWHSHPVWFLEGNPVVGYSKRKNGISLMFWSGQSFDEPALQPEGSFKAAEIFFTAAEQVNTEDLQRWLRKAADIQWDYKNIVKRKGVLERLK
ncbi:DUF1801 domain-containing protein [Panacibacter sp. DH6]|uniref:DUF1801 domain-containing protein n=1 Tax=Panacibacter microcysteis TaxID=2793269 RepID=A0A931E4E9_9BACT|nr:DUF1801 domain-containing protein [Panacibacter microcysteis]MBG9375336.1 DUF1801 domain-containing protein [Panacibacter microcysteis]